MLLLVLAHVDADHGAVVVEEEVRQRPGQLGLAHAGGAEEQERADGPVGVRQSGPAAADGVGHRDDGLVLAHHAIVEGLLHADELGQLGFHEPRDRDAGPAAHHLGHVLGVDLFLQHRAGGLELGQGLGGVLDAALDVGDHAVADLRGTREVAVAGEALGFTLSWSRAPP